jgi:diguanylate cyclase (GGDEF)-like protein
MEDGAERVRVLVVGEGPSALAELDGLELETAADLEAAFDRASEGDVDLALVRVDAADARTAIGAFRDRYPDLGVVAVAPPGRAAVDALDAGAADHLEPEADAETVLRSIRYATTIRRLERELHRRQTTDELTGLSNARGFEQMANHHLHLADRSRSPVAIVFVRLADEGAEDPSARMVEAAGVLRDAVRESDVLARVGTDVFAVLLTGDAKGAEALVLSRLVEALAVHESRGDRAPLSVSVGAAAYDPEHPSSLEELVAEADRRMREAASGAKRRPPV